MSNTGLTVEQRACVLRACREKLRRLQAEHHRLSNLAMRYALGPLEATQQEIDCLSGGITVLWTEATSKPP